MDARSTERTLLYDFDAVMRLTEAQLCSIVKTIDENQENPRDRLEIKRFVQPGPLWWAFNSDMAEKHSTENRLRLDTSPLSEHENAGRAKNGWVVLIDEIDKAESDVPNGLLEALGSGGFQPMGCPERVEMSDPPPLIVITTNEERILPDAFVRRCVVLHIVLPDVVKQKDKFTNLLIERGKAHFGNQTNEAVLKAAAAILARDRAAAIARKLQPRPGQAEYLDLLRAVIHHEPNNKKRQLALLESVANYIVRKPVDMQDTDELPDTTDVGGMDESAGTR